MERDKKILIALKKARSHLDKVIKMEEGEEYCIKTLQQSLAVMGLLKSANYKILERHLNSCFISAMEGANDKKKNEMISQVLQIIKMTK